MANAEQKDLSSTLELITGLKFSRASLGIYRSDSIFTTTSQDKAKDIVFLFGVSQAAIRRFSSQPFNYEKFALQFDEQGAASIIFDGWELENDPK